MRPKLAVTLLVAKPVSVLTNYVPKDLNIKLDQPPTANRNGNLPTLHNFPEGTSPEPEPHLLVFKAAKRLTW